MGEGRTAGVATGGRLGTGGLWKAGRDLKTAKALDLTIPPSLIFQADEVMR
jgi:hypothetical protein